MRKIENFNDSAFNNLPSYISYYYQIKLIPSKCKTILEVGIGNKFVSSQLKLMNKKVITVDNNENLNPDIVADIRKIPRKDNSVDCVICYEVLEHLPLDEFIIALKELKRITKRYLIISLPFSGFCYGAILNTYIKIPFSKGIIFRIPLPFLLRPKKLIKKMKINHYWAVGEAGASRKKIRRIFNKCGFKILKEISPVLNNHHIFWILKKYDNKVKGCNI